MAQRLDHNETGGLSPDHFLRVYRELRQARMPMQKAVATYRNALKRVKDAGVDTFALSILEKLVKVEEEQASLHIRNLFKYADWTHANVGLKQPDLFGSGDHTPTEEAVTLFDEQLAEENGSKAGSAGDKIETNPHQAGSAMHAAWARGWHHGQGLAVHRAFGKPPKQPTRRARNPAAETREQPPAAEGDAGAGEQSDSSGQDEQIDTSNVVPIRARRGRPPAAAKKPAASAKARKAADAAAAKLTGDAVVGETAF